MSKKIVAIIHFSKSFANVTLQTLAAIAGATSNPILAGAATAGAITLGMLDPLITKLTGKQETLLEIPLPDGWTETNEQMWHDICAFIEQHLEDIVKATEAQLQKDPDHSPNRSTTYKVFKNQIASRLSSGWAISNSGKDLATNAITKALLEQVSEVLNKITEQEQIDTILQIVQASLAKSDVIIQNQQAQNDALKQLLQNTSTGFNYLAKIEQALQPKPAKKVLIASLGDSPAVISSMYDLLTEGKQTEGKPIKLDRLVVLQPQEEKEGEAIPVYELVEKALADLVETEKLERVPLSYKDVDSEQSACDYLKTLYRLLRQAQKDGHEVYLSLAGGRKSMAAITAWVVPFFPCVKKLYHVLDPDEDHFPTLDDMYLYMTPAERQQAMHPNLDKLILVDIPVPEQQHISPTLHAHLLKKTANELAQMTDKDGERIAFFQTIAHGGRMLNVLVTKHVAEQFQALRTDDPEIAQKMKTFFERMQATTRLQYKETRTVKLPGKPPVPLHLVEYPHTSVRFAFYTLPKDILNAPIDEVKQAVICELESGKDGQYRTLPEIIKSPDFSTQPAHPAYELPPVPYIEQRESVLIVPLGDSPMVATQLYTLLKREYRRKIREVVLIYPQGSTTINNAVDLLKDAFLIEEKETGQKVTCCPVPLEDYDDINSTEACSDYQKKIEAVIEEYQNKSHYEIDLALSGGRKGMTAMTIFAAQNRNIPFVYHTLIRGNELSKKVERETSMDELIKTGLTDEKRNDLLFLRAYENELSSFILFRVPVFSNREHI